MLEIAREAPLDPVGSNGDITILWKEYEDQYFFVKLQEKGANLPDAETAKKFSVESIYDETPLGYHQPSRFFSDKLGEIEEWCPEARMVGAKRVWFD